MTQELDEGLAQRAAGGGVRRRDVGQRVQREHDADAHHLRRLQQHVLAAEPGHALVPDGRQQLLHVGVRHELQRQGRCHVVFLCLIDQVLHRHIFSKQVVFEPTVAIFPTS